MPIHDIEKSTIENDGRMPFTSHMTSCTNMYAVGEKRWGGSYSHQWKNTYEEELVRWLGAPIRHGARNGNPASMHLRWMKNDPDYDEVIANGMSMSRWRQIKSVVKLNNNFTTPKRGQEGYDPSSKYDHAFAALCHNMNYATKTADPDCGVDEATWGFSGYCAEVGGRLRNKKKDKGELISLFLHRVPIVSHTILCPLSHRWPNYHGV